MYNHYYPNYYRRTDRFGGGFIVPFVLGGLAGSLWNNNRPFYFYPTPTPYFYQQNPYSFI